MWSVKWRPGCEWEAGSRKVGSGGITGSGGSGGRVGGKAGDMVKVERAGSRSRLFVRMGIKKDGVERKCVEKLFPCCSRRAAGTCRHLQEALLCLLDLLRFKCSHMNLVFAKIDDDVYCRRIIRHVCMIYCQPSNYSSLVLMVGAGRASHSKVSCFGKS